MSELRVLLASWPDEEEVVAEIWRGDAYIGDVRRQQSGLSVTLAPSEGQAAGLRLDDLIATLTNAKARLEVDPPL